MVGKADIILGIDKHLHTLDMTNLELITELNILYQEIAPVGIGAVGQIDVLCTYTRQCSAGVRFAPLLFISVLGRHQIFGIADAVVGIDGPVSQIGESIGTLCGAEASVVSTRRGSIAESALAVNIQAESFVLHVQRQTVRELRTCGTHTDIVFGVDNTIVIEVGIHFRT